MGGTAQDLDLRPLFRDPDVLGTAVRVSVRLGATIKTFDIALFDQEKPITVTNFLAYLNAGRFDSNFFHRSVAGFVVQGGGFAWSSANNVVSVPTFEKIKNEPGISNLRGTVAMAKLGGDPDSATSQWFVNLADNSGNLDAQNGGFTVFGRVLGTGMTLVDEIAALPVYNAGSPFDSLPLKGYTSGSITRVYTVETNTALVPTLSFSAVSSNPSLVGASMTGTTLRLTPGASSGTTTITVSATDLDGAIKEVALTINVLAQSAGWHAEKGPDGEFNLFSLDRADSSPLIENPVPVHWGPVFLNTPSTRNFTITNKGPAALASFSITRAGSNPDDFAITSDAGPSTLAGGASTTFTVVFTPSAIGPRSALLHLTSSDPNEASLDIAVSGTGTSPDDVIPPTLSPASPQTLIADARRLAQIPDWRGTLVTATDNKEVVSFTQTPLPGSFQPIGDYSLIFSATDAAGNTSSVQSTLKVLYDPATIPQLSLSAALGGADVPAAGNTDLPAGSFLSAFGTPAISDTGSLAARVTITAGKARLAGIYWENEAGENKIVARQNQPSSGTNFKSFRDPVLAPGGAIAFAATLNGRKANEDEGLWTNLFGSLAPVLREGGEIPGLGGLKLKSITTISLEDDALLALVKLLPMPGLVTPANDTALVRITGLQAGRLLVRTGVAFDGSLIKQISVFQPAARSPGQGRWSSGNNVLAKLTLADRRTVVATLHNDGTQATLLQTRAAGAGLASLSLPALGGSSVAVLATKAIAPGITAANDSALYFAPNGTEFTDVIREEPGAGKFASFSDPVVNDQGEMLFFGTRRGAVAGSPSVTALWQINHLSPLQLVAQIGGPAADKEGNPLADTVWSTFTSFALPDGSGPVFVAQLSGRAVTGQKKLGLWAADSAGKVRQLLRTGDDVPFPAGAKRLTGFTILNALPGSFGVRRSYNASGALALQATFADRTQAILRVNVP
ncbi:MAG: peptidyl-prolyl cis-trans isomerase cyclophilin type [Chthoniobacteraceae bacterium]|nr:peptidyl-prolyl cis-trans isomerase cyclophilin type [Chthoniobacteraceae bacterium]